MEQGRTPAGCARDCNAVTAEFARLARPWRGTCLTRALVEYRNLHTVSRLIVQSALAREESRGAHYRNDFPKRDDANFGKHSLVSKGRDVSFVDFQRTEAIA